MCIKRQRPKRLAGVASAPLVTAPAAAAALSFSRPFRPTIRRHQPRLTSLSQPLVRTQGKALRHLFYLPQLSLPDPSRRSLPSGWSVARRTFTTVTLSCSWLTPPCLLRCSKSNLPRVITQVVLTGSKIFGRAMYEAGRQAYKSMSLGLSALAAPPPHCSRGIPTLLSC